MNHKVSVAMATYNGEKYIKQQLESILNNLKENDEIVISDDGSKDKTLEIVESFNDSRIKIFEGPQQGIIKNFENAIKQCTGDYIFLSDQDDIWFENKVDFLLKQFEKDDKLILLVHDNYITDENLNIIDDSFFSFRNIKEGLVNNIVKNSFIGCCMVFKKELIPEILPIPTVMPMHDQWIGLIAELNGRVEFVREKLMYYRRHSSNSSDFKRNSVFVMLKNRITILKCLLNYRRKHGK